MLQAQVVVEARSRRTFRLRPHQQKIANAVLDDLRAGKPEVLLAACPGFGKTETAIAIIRTMLREGRAKRVLVLAHGMSILRDNFEQRILKRAPELVKRQQVLVQIPQAHRKIEGEFDFVVVDEAHDFYDVADGLDEKLIKRVGGKQTLLLTGSPYGYIRQGKIPVHAYALFDLIRGGWASDIRVCLAESAYRMREKDWNEDGEVRERFVYNQRSTTKTMETLLEQFGKELKDGPTIYACKNIEMAEQVSIALNRRGIQHLESNHEADPYSREVHAFQRGEQRALVTVRRTTLGFDMPSLVNFVDLTGSRNPGRIFQMMNRLVRLPEDGGRPVKTFVKVMPVVFSREPLRYFMSGVCMLGEKAHYTSWDGGIAGRLKVPVAESHEKSPGDTVGRRRPLFDSGMMVFGDLFAAVCQTGRCDTVATAQLGHLIGVGVRNRDPAEHKREILRFFASNRRMPNRLDERERALETRFRYYSGPSSVGRDDAFVAELEALGWKRKGKGYFRHCERCGGEFRTDKRARRFCSLICAGHAARRLKIINCATCCREIRPRFMKQKFCSKTCSARRHQAVQGVGSPVIDEAASGDARRRGGKRR